jgi:hypothetical protein
MSLLRPSIVYLSSSENPSLTGDNVTFTADVYPSVTVVQGTSGSNGISSPSVALTLGRFPTLGNTLLVFGGIPISAAGPASALGFTAAATYYGSGGSSFVLTRTVRAGDGKSWTVSGLPYNYVANQGSVFLLEVQGTASILASAGATAGSQYHYTAPLSTSAIPGGAGLAIAGFWHYFLGYIENVLPTAYSYPPWLGGSGPGYDVVACDGNVPASTAVTATLLSTVDSGIIGQAVYVDIMVPVPTVPAGHVDFYDSSSPPGYIGTGTLSGRQTSVSSSSLPVGSQTITAAYSGDPSFLPGSGSLVQTVSSGTSPTTTSVVSSQDPSVQGQPVDFTATVSLAPELVQYFYSYNYNIQTGSQLTVTLQAPPTPGNTLVALASTSNPYSNGYYTAPAGFSVLASYTPGLFVRNAEVVGYRIVEAGDGEVWSFTQSVPFSGGGVDVLLYVFEFLGQPDVQAWAGAAGTQGTYPWYQVPPPIPVATAPLPGSATQFISVVQFWGTNGYTVQPSGFTFMAGPDMHGLTNPDNRPMTLSGSSMAAGPITATANVGSQNTVGYAFILVNYSSQVTGTVDFYDSSSPPGYLGSAPVVGGKASVSTSLLPVGLQTITADYLGNAAFLASSGTTPQTVTSAPVVTVDGTPNPSYVGSPVTIDVSVSGSSGTPTGTVTIADGLGSPPYAIGTVTLSGGSGSLVTSSLSVGSHTIWALYNGDINYPAASSYYIQVVVDKYTPVVGITSDHNPQFFGQELTLTATVSPPTGVLTLPTGTVTLTDSVTGGMGTYALPPSGTVQWTMDPLSPWAVGTHLVTASYSGDAYYYPGTATLSQLIVAEGGIYADLPGFALVASCLPVGDDSLPPWASFVADPPTAAPGQPVYLLWTGLNIASVRMYGDNGMGDSLDTGVLQTSGSGIYTVSNGFQHSITLSCIAYDSSVPPDVVASQALAITVT